jgi:hypothetical protein
MRDGLVTRFVWLDGRIASVDQRLWDEVVFHAEVELVSFSFFFMARSKGNGVVMRFFCFVGTICE